MYQPKVGSGFRRNEFESNLPDNLHEIDEMREMSQGCQDEESDTSRREEDIDIKEAFIVDLDESLARFREHLLHHSVDFKQTIVKGAYDLKAQEQQRLDRAVEEVKT